MNQTTVLVGIAALLAGFIGGFLLANRLNGAEIAALRAQGGRAIQANSNQSANDNTLSPEEIRAKIEEADRNASNFAFQKDLGIGLYRYATMKQDISLFSDAVRLLERANSLNDKDFDVLVALGNGHFDIGFAKKDLKSFEKAREVYARALAIKPDDADVQADMGISYFVQEPPDLANAASQLQKVADKFPTHSRSMQFLVEVYVRQNKLAEAEKMLARVREIDPSNPAVGQLDSLLARAKSGVN
jgi:tetratricopeptide (TPR) repeat protein